MFYVILDFHLVFKINCIYGEVSVRRESGWIKGMPSEKVKRESEHNRDSKMRLCCENLQSENSINS